MEYNNQIKLETIVDRIFEKSDLALYAIWNMMLDSKEDK